MHILIIDNHDSFTRNLEHLLADPQGATPGARCEIMPYSRLAGGTALAADLLVLSPGPGRPAHYPAHARVFEAGLPVLGICLGMQSFNEHFGGTTRELSGCVHGRAEQIELGGRTLLAARYHSLFAATVGRGLRVVSSNASGVPMALVHETRPLMGYQFHPESFLTTNGRFAIDHALQLLGLG